jgi:hypothetical protein
LTKEYLQAGTVLFKDVCAKEWAMNSTTLSSQVVSAASRACLTKDYLQAGVVLFKDTCTNEWAINPPEQQAKAVQTPGAPHVGKIASQNLQLTDKPRLRPGFCLFRRSRRARQPLTREGFIAFRLSLFWPPIGGNLGQNAC